MTFWLAAAAVVGGILYIGRRSDRKLGPQTRRSNADHNTGLDDAGAQAKNFSAGGRGLYG
jgi:hypothetical protein